LLSEEFDGGYAGGRGLLEPMLEIDLGSLGIPERTTLYDGLNHGSRISFAKGRVKAGRTGF